MTAPLWRPSDIAIEQSQMTQFTRTVEQATGLALDNYNALHAWSIKNPGEFWALFWDFAQIKASIDAPVAVTNADAFPGAQWFVGARFNFAENLLRERSDRIALTALLENGSRREYSYNTVYDNTAKIAQHLKHLEIQPGDRIAGWLPNIPETAIAMLATSSLGGVWSSCSPDFGIPGAVDRFGQIAPKVIFACTSYQYAGKHIDTTAKVREVVAQVPSIKTIVWVSYDEVCPQSSEPYKKKPHDAAEEHWEQWLISPTPPLNFVQLAFDHPLYILYSSGTTGKPKCIVHGQGGTLLQHMKEHQLHLDLRPSDTLFFFTTCGWMMWNWVMTALATTARIVLYDGSPFHPKPSALFDISRDENVTVFGVSAKFLNGTQKAGVVPIKTHNLNSLRMLISTGSPLTHEGFTYVYEAVKADCHLVSMSGGTDLISCFMLGNPNLAVYNGELQCAGLGMAVEIWDEKGKPLPKGKGELVCTRAFPSSPIGFWNDPNDAKYRAAYFDRWNNVWVHGDFAERTEQHGYIIHGRSDAVLNPGGVRIGTAEIYRQIEHFDDIVDAVCVGQNWQQDVRVILFVVMRDNQKLNSKLIDALKLRIRHYASPRHIPTKILQVQDIPRTMSGKIAELAVRAVIHNEPVQNTSALANPESLNYFARLVELQY
ncbi:MAG: acetoacetate--CoA ligase [Gammaproteobacteria bacterium]|nr:acetoacetate--CoA ligase [Gammaproteobacteria bacterium]